MESLALSQEACKSCLKQKLNASAANYNFQPAVLLLQVFFVGATQSQGEFFRKIYSKKGLYSGNHYLDLFRNSLSSIEILIKDKQALCFFLAGMGIIKIFKSSGYLLLFNEACCFHLKNKNCFFEFLGAFNKNIS
jgi:hypothetical protein